MKVTVGEAFARRKLKVRKDGRGYVEGQDKVSKLSDEDALVSYVDRHGSVTVILCELREDEWFQRGVVLIADTTNATIRNLRRQAPLSKEVQTLLQAAYHKEEEPPTPSDKAA